MIPMIRLCILLLLLSGTASAQSFQVTISPTTRTISDGQQATYTVTVTSFGGFDAPVALTLYTSGIPTGSRSLDRDTIHAPYDQTATLTISAAGVKPGNYSITVSATSGSRTSNISAALTVDRRLTSPRGRWTLYDPSNSELPVPLIRTIAFAGGTAWVGTASGLLRVAPEERPGETIMERSTIYSLSVDSLQGVWISSLAGLSRYSGVAPSPVAIPDSIPLFGSAILRIANSPDGSQWLVTRFGLVRHRYGVWTKYTEANSALTSDIIIDAAVTSTGDVWAAVDAGPNGAEPGLMHFDGVDWKGYGMTDMGLRADAIPDRIAIDRADRVWLVTDDGLVVGTASGFHREDPGFAVNAITSGSDGRVWVSSTDDETGSRRLAVYNEGSWTTYDDAGSGLRSGASFDELAINDSDGSIWIGSEGGLLIFHPEIAAGVASEMRRSSASIAISPNPIGSDGRIELVSHGGRGRIRLFDNSGCTVADIFNGRLEAGRRTIALDLAGIADGSYLLVVEIDGVVESGTMVIVAK